MCSSNDTECKSMLLILHNASVHYPLLRRLLKYLSVARNAHLYSLNKVMYICNHCKPIIRKNEVPACCVLNGLKCEPLPKELDKLGPLSCQLIQRAYRQLLG